MSTSSSKNHLALCIRADSFSLGHVGGNVFAVRQWARLRQAQDACPSHVREKVWLALMTAQSMCVVIFRGALRAMER
jgi:hypothetical protein